MTDGKDTKKGTLSLGGTLSVGNSASKAGSGVAVEVRRRRFGADASKKPAGVAAVSGDSEMARRMKVLEAARKNEEVEKQRREEELQKATDLQTKQVEVLEGQRKKEEEEKVEEERLKGEKEVSKVGEKEERKCKDAVEESKEIKKVPSHDTGKSRKTLTLGAGYKKKTGKSGSASGGKKRGRNAYMEALEQRYRTMPGRKKSRFRSGDNGSGQQAEKVIREVEISDFITVQELASRMAEKGSDVVKKLMMMGEMVTLTQTLDQEIAILIVEEFGHNYSTVSESDIEDGLVEEDKPKDMVKRSPIVTVMGHVDHGKTTLLDALRSTRVAAGEAGGITQHIGAYQVEVPSSGRRITFLDTPGHAAFTAMRARGAEVTDVVVLVVAADDGVMPQTIEAIHHAKAAGVPIVVAINKMDKPDANPDRVKNELLAHEVVLEEFGGEIPAVPISALNKTGLDEIEEVILLQADVLELQANPKRRADGVVVEAQLDKGRGSVATVVVQRGTLRTGDIVVAGSVWGRVRALVNDKGDNVDEAGPSVPVEILGLQGVPKAGDTFVVAEDADRAKEVASYREQKLREAAQAARKMSLDNLFDRMAEAEKMDLNVIIKADVQGSVEAIKHSLMQLDTPQISVKVIQGGVGVVTETDINLAMASGAVVCGFNVRTDAIARKHAEAEGIEIRYYSVIYHLIDDIKNAMAGLLESDFEEESLGAAEVRAIFKISKIKIAGCMVTEGMLKRSAKARLVRDGVIVHDGIIGTLRREKDEAKEVKSGFECGMTFDKFDDIQEGDVIESYSMKEVKKTFEDLEKLVEKTQADKAEAAKAKAQEEQEAEEAEAETEETEE